MKKTLLTLAMCAASLVGTANADFSLTPNDIYGGYWTLTGTGSYDDCYNLIKNTQGVSEDSFIRLGEVEGDRAEIIFSKNDSTTFLPDVMQVQFVNVSLEFKDIVALHPNPAATAGVGPAIVDYWDDFFDTKPGNLTISVQATAVEDWLDTMQDSLDEKASFTLVDNAAQILHGNESSINFQLIDGDNEIGLYDTYVYQDESLNNHTYTNVGVIWNESQLLKNQIAILYNPGPNPGDNWGKAGFRVVALGENYIQVPEPTTGSLSLLALAGLAARRRRK